MIDIKTTAQELDEFLRLNPAITAIDALVIDVNGKTLGKRIPISQARAFAEAGLSFSAVTPLMDSRGVGQNPGGRGRSDGDPDSGYHPVARTLRSVPWARRPIAQWLCTPSSGRAIEVDPRCLLRNVIDICLADGIRPVVACELEFYLLDNRRDAAGRPQPAPLARTGVAPPPIGGLSLSLLDDLDDILQRIERAAADQEIPVTGIVAEGGLQQLEINLAHCADPLAAADHAVLLKRLVQGVTRAADLDATFMAMPFLDQPGSGLHVHVSLVDDKGENRFGADGGDGLLRHAIGGLGELYEESYALFAPNVNSYRRMTAPFVPQQPNWGHNNRSVAFRVPSSAPSGRRIEHRVAGADASPHLVLAAILAGIHYGITRSCEPDAPTVGNVSPAGDQSPRRDCLSAFAALEEAGHLGDYIPAEYLRLYAALKRTEHCAVASDFLPKEHAYYL